MASIPKMTTINHAIHSDVEEVDPVLALVLFETNLLVVFAVISATENVSESQVQCTT